MSKPRMFYFGPWDQAGHHMRSANRPTDRSMDLEELRAESNFTRTNPWGYEVDGDLCPKNTGQGLAMVHHKDGWTALSFWDYTVDHRPGSHSTYLTEGTFTFEEMVAMAKERFAYRWNKIKFEVRLVPQPEAKPND